MIFFHLILVSGLLAGTPGSGYSDTTVNVLVLAGDRGEVITFVPGVWLQVKLRDGSKRTGALHQVKPGHLVLGGWGLGFESVVWFRKYDRRRDVVGKALTGIGLGLAVGGLAAGSTSEENTAGGAVALAGAGVGLAAAGMVILATRRKYRTSKFRLLVMTREAGVE